MNRLFLSILFIATLSSAAAQVSAGKADLPTTEVAVEYNYVRSNAPPADCECFSMNGGSVSVAQPFGSGHLAGVFDASFIHGSGISSGNYDLTLSSFTAGLRYRPFQSHWNPFGQVLVGVAHASGSLVEGDTPAATDSALTFASVIGGGLDYHINGHWSLRIVDADYLLTTYSNRVNDHQNNLRIGAGVAYRFGKR